MIFDAVAYAEGISNSAAGSSIETLVDTIDATVDLLSHGDLKTLDTRGRLREQWRELRAAIVAREAALGEPTTFGAPV